MDIEERAILRNEFKAELSKLHVWDFEGEYNINHRGQQLIYYAKPEFMKAVISYIADHGEVGKRVKLEETRERQQSVIDFCREVKEKMQW